MAEDKLNRLLQLCNPESIKEKIWKELEESLKQADDWLQSPPPQIHAELLVLDALTETRPVEEQVKRLNIALPFLIGIFAKTIAESNGEFLKLFLCSQAGGDK
jgi:hypothetical protein